MILKDKSLKDFWEWYLLPETLSHHKLTSQFKYSSGSALKLCFLAMSETCQNAVIIEWLDSVGIYVSVNFVNIFNELETKKGFESWVTFEHLTTRFRAVATREESINQALEKANEIYNL